MSCIIRGVSVALALAALTDAASAQNTNPLGSVGARPGVGGTGRPGTAVGGTRGGRSGVGAAGQPGGRSGMPVIVQPGALRPGGPAFGTPLFQQGAPATKAGRTPATPATRGFAGAGSALGGAAAATAPAPGHDAEDLGTRLQAIIDDSPRLPSRSRIRVTVEGGTIVLTGAVTDARERRVAELILRLTPRVRDVRNDLVPDAPGE